MSNREKADKFLEKVDEYLTECGWILDEYTLSRIDPISQTKHYSLTALSIQLDRDLGK